MADTKRVALITGGASGMGFAVAKELSESGWHVAIVDLNESQAEQALATLGSSTLFVRANVSSYDDQVAAFQETKNAFGQINFVFANAGIIGTGDFYNPADIWPPKVPS